MNDAAQQQSVGGSVDAVKLVVAVLLIIAGIVAFYVLQTQPDWVRWSAVAAGIVLAIVVFGSSGRGRAIWRFILDSRQEMRKVAWPTRQETIQTTLVVFVFVLIVGFFFWALDLFLSWAVRFLTGSGG